MLTTPPLAQLPSATPRHIRARIRHWWRQLAPQQQDRIAVLAPLTGVVLFFAAIIATVGYLRVEENNREKAAIARDVEFIEQRIRLHLQEQQDQLTRLGTKAAQEQLSINDFRAQAQSLLLDAPELLTVNWLDAQGRIKTRASANNKNPTTLSTQDWNELQAHRTPFYSLQARSQQMPAHLHLLIPLLTSKQQLQGALLVEYSIDGLFRYGVPDEVLRRYAVSFQDAEQHILAGNAMQTKKITDWFTPWATSTQSYALTLNPIDNGLTIRAQAHRATLGMLGRGLFWLVTLLSVTTAWMLLATWRHARRRGHAQQALIAETNFRRAMENSMPTGMRVMDLKGRITYVNSAFCEMTGWSEADLVGKTAPFPYWPEEDRDQLSLRLEEDLAGKAVPGGFKVRVQRKDKSIFHARLFLSPLVDANGQQSGWITSMMDITEPTRISEQLAASHQRFTTVLESLDASISVAPIGGNELLFANPMYRQWFGTQSAGHLQLVAQAGIAQPHSNDESSDFVDSFAGLPTTNLPDLETGHTEIYVAALGKWLQVRTRYLSWVDGRLAQMVIATDITAHRHSQEQLATQFERAQTASRLITMGEMASSVAHELNQPLTAINNYCSGMVSRLKSDQINRDELLTVLEKTTRQAQRAGQIIQRIRTFVKRSEPNRSRSDVATLVYESVELTELELRRFNVRLNHYVAARLPHIMVDRILIEQVLVNLLRNAAESIQSAQRPTSQRIIELRVVPCHVDDKPGIEFSVQDTGQGLAPEVMNRLYETFYSTKSDGMGIGLSLCRSIVESHFGRMQAENIYNGTDIAGCRFSFWIPLSEVSQGEPQLSQSVNP